MSSVEVERYSPDARREWDGAVRASRTGVFLFERDYMDYHADRFLDHSLLFRSEGHVLGVLAANEQGDVLQSHGGLTFGGLLSPARTTAASVLEIFDALRVYLRDSGFSSLLYKAVPHIYHDVPAEEDLYALFRSGARLVRRDLSSSLQMDNRVPVRKGRRSGVNVARRAGIVVERSNDYTAFMELEEENLRARHGVRPVHSAAELTLLADRFPGNIALYTASLEGELVAGTVVYESRQVAHTQYIAASESGRRLSAMDLVLHRLLTEDYAHKRWFDFGISTEDGGQVLNTGLAANKESYGGRATVHDFYRLTPA